MQTLPAFVGTRTDDHPMCLTKTNRPVHNFRIFSERMAAITGPHLRARQDFLLCELDEELLKASVNCALSSGVC